MNKTIDEDTKAALEKMISDGVVSRESAAKYFPELKESDGEETRKEIIAILKYKYEKFPKAPRYSNVPKWIDWLEKQGAHTALSKDEQNKLAKGVLRSCAFSFINYLDSHRYEGKMDVSNGECEDIENAFQNAMWDRLHRYYCKYIEKQGEQKPAWSEEDERIRQDIENLIHFALEDGSAVSPAANTTKEGAISWIQSLKDRVQPKQEWSEEDESHIRYLIECLEHCKKGVALTMTTSTSQEYINWLKSLKPQSKWQPSDEQITWLYRATDEVRKDSRMKQVLNGLLCDLKKLREE